MQIQRQMLHSCQPGDEEEEEEEGLHGDQTQDV